MPAGVLNINEHPLLQPAVELGNRLLERGANLPGRRPPVLAGSPLTPGALADLARAREQSLTAQGVTGPPTVMPHTPTVEEAFPGMPVLSPAPAPSSSADPEYPPLARMARVQGTISLAVAIGADGHPYNIRVMRGHPLLVQAAINAVKNWTYPPVAQASAFEADVNFTLPPGPAPPLPADAPRKGSRGEVGNQEFFFGPSGESKPSVPDRIKVGGNVQSAMLVKKVDPVYPDLAKAAGIQGTVTLDIVIGKDGTVESLTAVEGHPLLVQAALDAVRQWTYKTTLLNGEPVGVATSVTVPFQLQ